MIVARRMALLSLCLSLSALSSSRASDQECNTCPPAEPRWHSEAWWAARAQEPVGARQEEHQGKLWPPYPRPVGPKQPCSHIYHAEHYWPWPYHCIDRQVVLDMTRTQEANGWLTETTLYGYHFNPETNELTVPGRLHLKWILQYVPPSARAVYLEQTEDPAVNQQRMNGVRNAVTRLVGEANCPQITFRVAMPPERPAIEVDTIRRHELESIPTPRIPFESSASGASSTATGGQSH
jgi:hypothetical protein